MVILAPERITFSLFRSCIRNSDSSGNLILEGVQRVRLGSYTREPGFTLHEVKPFCSYASSVDELNQLGLKILQIYEVLKSHNSALPTNFDSYLAQYHDVEKFADIIASMFVSDPLARQELLEEENIATRMKRLIECLSEVLKQV